MTYLEVISSKNPIAPHILKSVKQCSFIETIKKYSNYYYFSAITTTEKGVEVSGNFQMSGVTRVSRGALRLFLAGYRPRRDRRFGQALRRGAHHRLRHRQRAARADLRSL